MQMQQKRILDILNNKHLYVLHAIYNYCKAKEVDGEWERGDLYECTRGYAILKYQKVVEYENIEFVYV